MKNTKIGSIILFTLITVFTLSVVTMAWISINTDISVKDIVVKPSSGENLFIKNSGMNSEFSVVVSPTNAGTKVLKPASTCDLQNFYHAESVVGINQNGQFSESTKFVKFDPKASNEYCFYDEFYIKSSVTMENFKISNISVTDDKGSSVTSEYSKCLRVGISINNKSLIFAPVAGADTEYEAISDYSGSASTSMVTVSTAGLDKLFSPAMQANTEHKVSVFVWYEGQDKSCKSSKLSAVEELKITISFAGDPLNVQ